MRTGEGDLVVDRLARDLLVVVVVKGQRATQQQVENDAEREYVDALVVAALLKNLGRDVALTAQ